MATLRELAVAALGGAALVTAVLAVSPAASASPGQSPSAPCYNGLTPLNPYVDNCGLLPRPPRVLGSAPDQTALLNCSVGSKVWRAQCLSQFVNGGYGGFPGAVVAPG